MKDTKIKLGMIESRVGNVVGLKNADGNSLSGQLKSLSINALGNDRTMFEVHAKLVIKAEDIEAKAQSILPNGSYSFHA